MILWRRRSMLHCSAVCAKKFMECLLHVLSGEVFSCPLAFETGLGQARDGQSL